MLTVQERYVSEGDIQTLYQTQSIQLKSVDHAINEHCVLRSNLNEKNTAVVKHLGNGLYSTIKNNGKIDCNGISPKDVHQLSFMDSLLNENILIKTAFGSAGTGKTTMAMAYATQRYLDKGRKIFLTKPTTFVGNGKAFGSVPGDIQEKYDPYLASYYIVLEKIFKSKHDYYFKEMKKKGDLQFIPIALSRGCTYDNATFIIDECQNLNWHELNSIVSRMGENTELIILGDLKQIDIRVSLEDTGLYQFTTTDAFRLSPITSCVELLTQYRSPITQLIAEAHEEIRERKQQK